MATAHKRDYYFSDSTALNSRGKKKRLRDGEEPDEALFTDLLYSTLFKLNKEDRATNGSVGHVLVASDVDAKAGTSTGNAVDTEFTNVIQPHQLPTVHSGTGTDDTITNTINNFSGVALNIAPDSTTTRNRYVTVLSSTFKTWFSTVLNTINTTLGSLGDSIGGILSRLTTAETNITNNASSITTANTNITSLGTNKLDKSTVAGGTTDQVLAKNSNTNDDFKYVNLPDITVKADKTQFLLESISDSGPTSFSPTADLVVLTLTPSASKSSAKMKYTFMGYTGNTTGGTRIIKIKKNGSTIASTEYATVDAQQMSFCLVWIDAYTATDVITATIAAVTAGAELNNYILICEAVDAI